MAEPLVVASTAGRVSRIVLRSPQTRNALSGRVVAGLASALVAADDDRSVDVVVLDHEGPAFCSGGDMRPGQTPDPADVADLLYRLAGMRPVTVVRAAGPAVGAGLALIAAADLSVVAADAPFGLPEVGLGLVPGVASVVVGQRMAQTRLLHLALTGEGFTGAQGAAWGVFTSAVPVPEVDATVDALLAALEAASPSALVATKRVIRTTGARDLSREDLERAAVAAAGFPAGPDAAEARAARAAGRTPRWPSARRSGDT